LLTAQDSQSIVDGPLSFAPVTAVGKCNRASGPACASRQYQVVTVSLQVFGKSVVHVVKLVEVVAD